MSTSKQCDAGKERFWRRMVRDWRKSGLSVRAFCRAHGLSEPSMYAWRRTLAQRDADSFQFVPVTVDPDEPVLAPDELIVAPDDGTDGRLELVLQRGRRLRIAPGFDADTLRQVLVVLEEDRPC
jgi:transposase-like protein